MRMPKRKAHEHQTALDVLFAPLYRLIFICVVVIIFIGDIVLAILTGLFTAFDFLVVSSVKTPGFLVSRSSAFAKKIVNKLHISVPRALTPTKNKPSHHYSVKIRYFLYGILTGLIGIALYQSYLFVTSLPNPRLIGSVNFSVSTQIFDRHGALLYDLYRDQDRTPVKIDSLPEDIIHATLSIEDRNFYNHNGISLVGGVLRAMKDTYKTGDLQGGSTITQQLVKTSLLSPERTFERKVKEVILAIWTERIYTKKQILEMYLNQVAYGGTAYGIEEASRTYFDKSAQELTLSESALLAGLTRAPSSYSPYVNPQLAIQRRNEVLQSMYETGYISKTEYDTEVRRALKIQPPKNFIRAPHFVFYVKSLLEKKYGIRRVEEGGLRVVTTLDITMQDEIEKILKEEVAKVASLNVSNGAVLVTSPSTGEILAMVGSKNYYEDPYGAFNVATARRQPGSSIKPLVYALALEKGILTASTPILDAPIAYVTAGAPRYVPVNYDGQFHGNVPMRFALANSYNIPAVKTLEMVGVRPFIDFAQSMGITTWDTPTRYGLSLALGGAEVKMVDMAEAYGVFANYGSRVDLNPLLKVEDYRGNVLEEFHVTRTDNIISPKTAFIMSDILSDNNARKFAFGLQSDLNIPGYKVAVKTGTTNSKRDNWTHGYTRKFFVGVWVGNNNNTPMNPQLTSGVTGASPIWKRVMTYVLDKNIPVTGDVQPPTEFSLPEGIASRSCYGGVIEYYMDAEQASKACPQGQFGLTPTPAPQINL